MKATSSTNLALVAYQSRSKQHNNLALADCCATLTNSTSFGQGNPLILKRYRHAKMADASQQDSNDNAPDKEKDDFDEVEDALATQPTTVDKDKEALTSDLPVTDASDNPLPEDPLNQEDLNDDDEKDMDDLDDLDDLDDMDDLDGVKDLNDLDDLEDLDDMDDLDDEVEVEDDLESLSDKPSDEITKALEDLAEKGKDKITVQPIRSYENSYDQRNDILAENNRKAGVYR